MITDKNFSDATVYLVYWRCRRQKRPTIPGRVRVRCIGIHTDDKIELPTRLTWAQCVMPVTGASISVLVIRRVSCRRHWVFGYFRDGESMQSSCIGSIPADL